MPVPALHFAKTGSRWLCLAGLCLSRLLSADLFMELAGVRRGGRVRELSDLCHERWTDLAGTIAAMPESPELHVVLSCGREEESVHPVFTCGVLAAGRARTKAQARALCLRTSDDLGKLFTSIIDYAEFEPVTDDETLARLTAPLVAEHVTEIGRRLELIRAGKGRMTSEPILGFAADDSSSIGRGDRKTGIRIPHLFPWIPSNDSWWRLADVMAKEKGPAALVVHARGWPLAPEDCLRQAHAGLAGIEAVAGLIDDAEDPLQVLGLKARTLQAEALHRLAAMEGPVIGARIFLCSGDTPSAALVSSVEAALCDPSVDGDQPGGRFLFKGGATVCDVERNEVISSMESPSLKTLFSPTEATAVLRTPMPTDDEFPGFPLNRARTAPILGAGGDDTPLGVNVHRGLRREAALDTAARYRHTYVIGQTGTGKSNFLLHGILHDIRRGRGVCVLDPHGTLIEDILLRFPRRRARDLVIMDMTDVDCPVGFNPLLIEEDDQVEYRTRRDLLIDEIYGYLDRTYDLKLTGGPIFETHFRGMLALLLGFERPKPPLIPNLLAFRLLYTNEKLRQRLVDDVTGRDYMLDEFVREALAARRDVALGELAPYVTSKFSRFISDLNLRNITCQNRTLDLDAVVDREQVLLINLGKGRIGDYASGLLASQVVSRVQRAVMRRGREGAGRPSHLYADEFQLVASKRFAELLAEGRKFGLSITMAHQYASQIPQDVLRAVIGNVGTTILFRVGSQDGDFFSSLFAPTFGERDLIALPNYRAYVRGAGAVGPCAFNVDIPPPESKIDPVYAESLREQVRKRYGRPREDVEKEIAVTSTAYRRLI